MLISSVAPLMVQTDANPDPFTLTIAYYGYDHYNGVTTYLGYFIVSINQTTSQGTKKYASDANNYWELFVNGNPSTDGMDSVLVEPGDQVEFKWVPAGPAAKQPAARLQRVLARRPN